MSEMIDQLTYNRMRRRGGFLSLPECVDEDGKVWFYMTIWEPRLDRVEVTEYLRAEFASAKSGLSSESCDHGTVEGSVEAACEVRRKTLVCSGLSGGGQWENEPVTCCYFSR